MTHGQNPAEKSWWAGLTLQQALFAGVCALLIVGTRVVLDLHLKVPGHTMLLAVFLLCVGRGCIGRPHAGTVIAFMVGIFSLLAGTGKSGPLIFFKMFLPGVALDLGMLLLPRGLERVWSAAVLGGLAGAARFPAMLAVDLLIGMEWQVALQHSGVRTFSGTLFAAAGGALAPLVLRRLQRSGML